MTDLASALAAKPLSAYRGQDVLRTALAIRNAGDGLSAAMKVDPVELDLGATVYVVLECRVAAHDHAPIDDTNALELKQVLRAGAAVIVDADLVKEHLDRQAERIKAAQDQAKGVVNLDGEPGWLSDSKGSAGDEEDPVVVFRRNHMAGNHRDGTVTDCPICDEEIAAEQTEAAEDAAKEDPRTVDELRADCKERGVAYTGKDRKVDLIRKLADA